MNKTTLETLGFETRRAAISAASSDAYARKYNTFSRVVEMPDDDEPRVNDQSLTNMSRREARR